MSKMVQYYEQIKKYYQETGNNPVVIAMAEMAGFPNPITGNITTYMDLLKKGFLNHQLSTRQFYDFQSLFFQKASFIQNLLKHNLTVAETYRLFYHSVEATKKDLLTNLTVRDSLKKRYPDSFNDTSIREILHTGKGTVVLRSSLSNDISYKLQENVISVLGKKGRKHAVAVLEERGHVIIDEVISDICKNYDTIYALNPYALIMEIGIEQPKIFQMLDGNVDMKIINSYLDILIKKLKEELAIRNIPYITGSSVESTTLANGQKKIYEAIVQTLAERLPKEEAHESTIAEFDEERLFGILAYEGLQSQTIINDIIHEGHDNWNLYHEHKYAERAIQKTIFDMRRPKHKIPDYSNDY